MSTIGVNIKRRREELGITQEELSKRLGFKSKSSINKIELGIQDLGQSKIKTCADALGVTPSYLMGWEDDVVDYDTSDLGYLLEKDTDYTLKFIGSIFKGKRIKDNLTEKHIADKSKITIAEYLNAETGAKNIGEKKIISIMEALDIEFHYFIGLITGLKITLKTLKDHGLYDELKDTVMSELFKQEGSEN